MTNDLKITGIVTPNDNDVLSGRGGNVNSHPGNRRFREYVFAQKHQYAATPFKQKPAFAKLIVSTIRNLVPPGRFLSQDKETKLWSDVGDKKAWKKTRQALREKISTLSDSTNAPADGFKATSNGPQTSAISSSSAFQLREMLVRQLLVTSLDQDNKPKLSENVISSNEESESRDSFIHDQFEKPFPLRSSSTNRNMRSSLKPTPMIPEGDHYDSIGTFSSGGGGFSSQGLSLMTDPSCGTNLTNTSGISFATGSSNGTASCSSEYGAANPNYNSLFLEGMAFPSFSQFPNIGEGKEDEDCSISEKSKQFSDGTVKSDEMMSITSRRRSSMASLSLRSILRASFSTSESKRPSTETIKSDEIMSLFHSSSSSLSGLQSILKTSFSTLVTNDENRSHPSISGMISLCENMPTTGSGIFPVNDREAEEWQQDLFEWEKEAEIEDIQLLREALLQLEEDCEEVDNLNEMSSMMSDTCLR